MKNSFLIQSLFILCVSCGDGDLQNSHKAKSQPEPYLVEPEAPKTPEVPKSPAPEAPKTPEVPKPCCECSPKCDEKPTKDETQFFENLNTLLTDLITKLHALNNQNVKDIFNKIDQAPNIEKMRSMLLQFLKNSCTELNWDTLLEAAELYVKNEDLEDEDKSRFATKIVFLIYSFEAKKAHIHDACYSDDIEEVSSQCIPYYFDALKIIKDML